MSVVEKVVIIALCLLPIVALLILLPKKLFSKKAGKKKDEPKAPAEEKPEEPKPMAVEDKVEAESKSENTALAEDDSFKEYVKNKAKNTPAPKPGITDRSGFGNFDGDLLRRPMPAPKPEEKKTLKQEIDSLSPELKALLFSGALDPKHFDKDNNT